MMYNAIGTREHVKVVGTETFGGMRVDILEYQELRGMNDTNMAQNLWQYI